MNHPADSIGASVVAVISGKHAGRFAAAKGRIAL
jgi:hypothetical protein